MSAILAQKHSMDAEKLGALPDLKEKSVLITGVSGIGGAFANMCIEKGAAKVFIVDRMQEALDGVTEHANLVKILVDIGKEEAPQKIKEAVGTTPINWMVLAAACPSNPGGMGASCATITREELDDMMKTDVHGKLFVLQALAENLKSATPKARVFNVGMPPADAPKPDGTYMVIPGFSAFIAVKAANKSMHEGLKMEMKDCAEFGYGHPGVVRTGLTNGFADDWSAEHMMNKMIKGRFAAEDYHVPAEMAAMFYSLMSKTTDEEFSSATWNIVKMYADHGKDLGVKATSDVGAGINLASIEAKK